MPKDGVATPQIVEALHRSECASRCEYTGELHKKIVEAIVDDGDVINHVVTLFLAHGVQLPSGLAEKVVSAIERWHEYCENREGPRMVRADFFTIKCGLPGKIASMI